MQALLEQVLRNGSNLAEVEPVITLVGRAGPSPVGNGQGFTVATLGIHITGHTKAMKAIASRLGLACHASPQLADRPQARLISERDAGVTR